MLQVLVSVGITLAAFLGGYALGWRRCRQAGAQWLVRPHTRRSMARMPDPEPGAPTVSQAAFVRTNLPGSTSKME